MTNRKRRILPAVVAGALGMGAAAVYAEPSQQDLQSQVKELEAKVATLEGRSAAQTADVAASIDSVLRDAQKHSQLLDQMAAGTAGHNDDKGGFTIASGNDFSLNLRLGAQFRNVTNYAKDSKHGGNDDSIDNGFEITRARFIMEGNAWTRDLTYFVQWDAGDINGGVTLLDAYVQYRFADQWAMRAGQYKDPVHHEAMVDPFMQLGVDRSLANELLGTPSGINGRVQGVEVLWPAPGDNLHAEIGFHDGMPSGNTNFQDGAAFWGTSGRVEYKVMGNWRDYDDFSARDTLKDLLVLGGGFDYTQGANFNAAKFTVDAQWELATHLGVYAALFGQYFDPRNALPGGSNFDWGALVQAGYAVNKQWEVYARGDMAHFDRTQINDQRNFYELGVGVNYFLGNNGAAFHRAKVSVDLSYLPNGAPSVVNGQAATGLSYLDILGGSDAAQFVLRAQVQFVP